MLAREIARLAAEKRASGLVILDMREACSFTDYFVIGSGRSVRQTAAICDEVRVGLKKQGIIPLRVEGERQGDWVLMDYLDVVLHVFTPAARDFYRLEVLWKEARRLETEEALRA